FVDRIKVFAQAGKGGRGCVSFRREKFVPKGGPDGGDGGRGGDIILRADRHTDHLAHLFYEPIIKAKNGGHGRGKKMHGKNAPDKIVKVPIGTMVYQLRSGDGGVRSEGERSDNSIPDFENSIDDEEIVGLARRLPDDQSAIHDTQSDLLADLAREDQEFLLCKGGAGGKGNVHFKSSRNRAPREYTEGGEGESGNFLLELRSIADVALVGYPNAGKSSSIIPVCRKGHGLLSQTRWTCRRQRKICAISKNASHSAPSSRFRRRKDAELASSNDYYENGCISTRSV